MAEQKELNTKTNALANGLPTLAATNATLTMTVNFDDSAVNVGTERVELEDPNTSQVELLEERRLKNAIEGIECELLINQSVDIIYEVDVDGSLYVTDQKAKAENYEINNNAELIFNHT